MSAADVPRPGDRVRHRESGDVGTVVKWANLQVGPNVAEDNPLLIVRFPRLGDLRDVDVKLTADALEPVDADAPP